MAAHYPISGKFPSFPLAYNRRPQTKSEKVVNLESQAEPKADARIGLAKAVAIGNARIIRGAVPAAATIDAIRARARLVVICAILI